VPRSNGHSLTSIIRKSAFTEELKKTLGVSENGTFHRCIELINTGEVTRAKSVLALDVICKGSEDVAAWALMAHLADDRAEEIRCLEQVLRLRPQDTYAKMHLMSLRNKGANGRGPSAATTRPLRYSPKEIMQGSEGSSSSWSRLQGRGFGTSNEFLGWGIVPDLQGTWPADLKFRSLTAPFAEVVGQPREVRGLSRAFRRFSDALLMVVILGALVLLMAPRLMGANLLVVVSQSMEPTIPMGSIVVSHPQTVPDEIGIGDVITFVVPDVGGKEVLVTHRVVEVIGSGVELQFRTQGDAVEDPDMALVTPDQLVGRVWFSLPLIGYLVAFIRTPLGYIVLVGLPALVFILSEWWTILRAPRSRASPRLAAVPLHAGGGAD
jgi:signal peptidase